MWLLSLVSKSVVKVNKLSVCTVKIYSKRYFGMYTVNMSESLESQIAKRTKQLAPPLTNDRHKGQAGRIGVFGGSLEFTGKKCLIKVVLKMKLHCLNEQFNFVFKYRDSNQNYYN